MFRSYLDIGKLSACSWALSKTFRRSFFNSLPQGSEHQSGHHLPVIVSIPSQIHCKYRCWVFSSNLDIESSGLSALSLLDPPPFRASMTLFMDLLQEGEHSEQTFLFPVSSLFSLTNARVQDCSKGCWGFQVTVSNS
jgi:hypothetical protein